MSLSDNLDMMYVLTLLRCPIILTLLGSSITIAMGLKDSMVFTKTKMLCWVEEDDIVTRTKVQGLFYVMPTTRRNGKGTHKRRRDCVFIRCSFHIIFIDKFFRLIIYFSFIVKFINRFFF